jgi:hypothetical protein
MYRWKITYEYFIREIICEAMNYTEFIQTMLQRGVVFIVMVTIFRPVIRVIIDRSVR